MKKIEIEIPIYRAKKLGSDDNIKSQSYIKKLIGGNYHHYLVKYYSPDYEDVEIDPSTLAIHFHDMLDSKGNKIFASLNKTGKGGDILKILQLDEDEQFEIRTVLYRESSIIIENQDFKHYCHLDMINLKFAETTGIQEWK